MRACITVAWLALAGAVIGCKRPDRAPAPSASASLAVQASADAAPPPPLELPEPPVVVQAAFTVASTREPAPPRRQRTPLVTDGTYLYWADVEGVHALALDAAPGDHPHTVSTKMVQALGAGPGLLFAVTTVESKPAPAANPLDRHGRNAILQLVPPGKAGPVLRTDDGSFVEAIGVTSTTLVRRESRYTDILGFDCALRTMPLAGGSPSEARYEACGDPGAPIIASGANAFTVERARLLEWDSDATKWRPVGSAEPVSFDALAASGPTLFATGCVTQASSPGLGAATCGAGSRRLFRYGEDAGVREEPLTDALFRNLAVDDAHMYWLDTAGKTVRRRSKGAAGPGVVVSDGTHGEGSHLLVTAARVYWLEETFITQGSDATEGFWTGAIRAIPKP